MPLIKKEMCMEYADRYSTTTPPGRTGDGHWKGATHACLIETKRSDDFPKASGRGRQVAEVPVDP